MRVNGLGCVLYRMPLKGEEKKEQLIFGKGTGIEIDMAAARAQENEIVFSGEPE